MTACADTSKKATDATGPSTELRAKKRTTVSDTKSSESSEKSRATKRTIKNSSTVESEAESSVKQETQQTTNTTIQEEAPKTKEGPTSGNINTRDLTTQQLQTWINQIMQYRAQAPQWAFINQTAYSITVSPIAGDDLVYIEVNQEFQDHEAPITKFRINAQGQLEEENSTNGNYQVIAETYGENGAVPK